MCRALLKNFRKIGKFSFSFHQVNFGVNFIILFVFKYKKEINFFLRLPIGLSVKNVKGLDTELKGLANLLVVIPLSF